MMTMALFYQKLLGIAIPWIVTSVLLDEKSKRVDVYIAHDPHCKPSCPDCRKHHAIYDHTPERTWRHLDSCNFETYIHARLPRVSCGQSVKVVAAPWAADGGRFTIQLESRCIDTILECDISGAERLTGLCWSSLWIIVERAVQRGQARKPHAIPPRIGVDEKAFGKFHRYETLVYDLDRGTVEFVADDRTKASLAEYFKRFSQDELASVKTVAMDMWEAYISAVRTYIPGADDKIVFDRFHAMQYVTNAVDNTRRKEHKELLKEDNNVLAGTRYLWLWNDDNIPESRREEFMVLKAMNLKAGRAWSIKESLRNLWNATDIDEARMFFKNWYNWATHSRLPDMIKAAKTLNSHLAGVLNHVTHKVTNACAEGLNSKVEMVKRMACGFRNRGHYKTMIYFHCGGLDLHPAIAAS